MQFLIIGLIVLGLFFGPQLWVRYVMRRHSAARADFPGTGGQFARHLLDRLHMQDVQVELTERGDHYDPQDLCVRLSHDVHRGKSLTAVTVAAHEVGHALQHRLGYSPLLWRTRLAMVAGNIQRLGNGLLLLAPVAAGLTRSPSSAMLFFAAGLASFGSAAVVHLITLPVEWDASFRRALPLLREGGYLSERDQQAARQVLSAAALTYVAGSLAGILGLWRWLQVLRR